MIYGDKLVKIYEKNSLLPHGMDVQYLIVGGKTFSHLTSYRYVLIPEWNSISFVTHRVGGKYKLHIFDLEMKQDIMIDVIERPKPARV